MIGKDSALTDRISVVCSACAFPLSAYYHCAEYEASRFGIFDDENRIRRPDKEGVKALEALIQEANERVSLASKPTDLAGLRELLKKLQAARDIPMTATQHKMKNDGYAAKREVKLSVQKDHFVAAPAYHSLVREILRQIKGLDDAAARAIRSVEEAGGLTEAVRT